MMLKDCSVIYLSMDLVNLINNTLTNYGFVCFSWENEQMRKPIVLLWYHSWNKWPVCEGLQLFMSGNRIL